MTDLTRKELAYYAMCASEFAWNMEDEDDETAVIESARTAISYLRRLGIPHTNRAWSNIVDDATVLYLRLADERSFS